MSWWRRLVGGERLPDGFAGRLEPDERVLTFATVEEAGPVVATTFGLWLPEGRRVGWHLISKATWAAPTLVVVEAEETGTAGEAVLLRDLPGRRLRLVDPGGVPEIVHKRVTGSIRSRYHREVPGAWFVQRVVPGRDGVQLQVRPDPGSDEAAVHRVAAEVAATIARARTDRAPDQEGS